MDETTPKPPGEAWDRIVGESKKAHAAFLDYARMGPARSLRKLHEAYREHVSNGSQTKRQVPTDSFSTLATWSVRNNWQERVKAFDEEQSRIDAQLWEERRRQEREADWDIGSRMRKLAADILTEAPSYLKTQRRVIKGRDGEPDREIVTVRLDGRLAVKAAELASQLQRLAADMAPPKQSHDFNHTGEISFIDFSDGVDPKEDDAEKEGTE